MVDKTNDFVLTCLGEVLGMQTPDVQVMRFSLQTNADFIFYFRFSLQQHTLEKRRPARTAFAP
ncbi:TPA: hypothetical protein EYO57_35650, partial [Candidatus Poribacteria bacterium]|nr:hypothetical protein [Candidatus Poribacteria bacterium]